MFSSIVRKGCKGNCGRMPEMGGKGWCFTCKPEYKQAIINKNKKRNAARLSATKLRSLAKVDDSNIEKAKDYDALDRWFREVRKRMTGVCENCGGKSCRDNDKEYKRSIAHILPKAYFKSVATHPDNFLELCFYGNSCHTNFDNKMIDLIDLHCFDTVIQKFTKMYPFIAKDELRRVPPILIEYLKTEI